MPESLLVHSILPQSSANGPGLRTSIWVQGCTLACEGCFNPRTHPRADGTWHRVDELASSVASLTRIEGVTITGGEPLQQWEAVHGLLVALRSRAPRLSVIVLSGYTIAEIRRMGRLEAIRSLVDALIAGRYQQEFRVARGIKGSANKQVMLCTTRYTIEEIEQTPEAEVIISPSGVLTMTGVDPLGVGDCA